MADLRRPYGNNRPPETFGNQPTTKPAYFYYPPQQQPQQQQFQRPAAPTNQMPVTKKENFNKKLTTTTKNGKINNQEISMNEMGEFRQEPDGTIVLIQPDPIEPNGKRTKCAKFVIFGSNIVLMIVGCSLLSMGAWLKIDDRFRDLLSENFRQVTAHGTDPVFYVGVYIIIAAGLVMVVVSFFGCCGAILNHQCLLITYFVLLMITFFLQVSVIVLILLKHDKIELDIGDSLIYMVQHYYQGPGIVTDAMDMLQTTFRCCGNSGCADYEQLRMNVPRSCDIQCDGCRYRMFRFFRDGFIVIGVAMTLVFIAEMLAISFSMYLFCLLRRYPTKYRRRYIYKATEPMPPTSPTSNGNYGPAKREPTPNRRIAAKRPL